MGQSIFSNVIISTISRAVVVLLGLCATALTVRIISVESFGTYSLVLTIGTFLQLFADFGLYLTASREIGASKGDNPSLMNHIVSLRMALLLSIFIVGLIVFLFIPSMEGLALLFLLLSVGLVFQSMSQLMMGVFQAYGVIWKATVGDILGRAVQVALLWYLYYTQAQPALMGVAFAFTVSLCAAFAIHALLVPHRNSLFPKVSLSAWRYLAKSSWPIGLMLILNVIYFRSDIIILSFFRSTEEIGWYGLAYKIIENGLFFPAMLGGLLLPHISSSLALNNMKRAQDIVSEGLTLSLYIAIVVVTMLVVFASPIIVFIAGPDFYNSVPLLRILSLALVIMFMGNIFGFALIALSQQRKLAVLYGILAFFNIAANILFVPLYGALAAAWVTVATEAIAMLTAAFIVYTMIRYRIPWLSVSLAVCSAGVAAYVGMLMPAHIHIGVRLAVVAVLYAGIGYTAGLWNKKTLNMLRGISSL